MNATKYRAKLEADVADKRAAVESAVTRLAKAEEKLKLFQSVAQGTAKLPAIPKIAVKRKPGRPKKAEASPGVVIKRKPGRPRKEPVEAPKKRGRPRKDAAAPAKKRGRPAKDKIRAAEGRAAVARGDRPSIKEAVRTVMGDKIMSASEILELIKARHWTPNANDPKTYIAYILSATKAYFERVPSKGRGYYQVRKEALVKGNGKPVAVVAPKAAKAAKQPKAPKVKAAAPKAKVAAPKPEAPKVEVPKVEAPKAKPEAPKAPKVEVKAPKVEPEPEAKPKRKYSVDEIIAEAVSPMGTFGE